MERTDNEIMLAVRAGATEQLGLLFERHHGALFAFFYRMTGERSVSEDLVQEVFLKMLRYRASFHDDSQFRGWMYQIARNARIDDLKKRGPQTYIPVEAVEIGGCEHPFEAGNMLLERALLALPEQKREILILARYQEMKYEEIAALLGIDAGTVKGRVHRAMKELREVFFKMSGEKSKCDVKKSANILRTI